MRPRRARSRRVLARLAALATCAAAACAVPPLAPDDAGCVPTDARASSSWAEASGEIDETGGLVSLHLGERAAYLSVPPDAVPSPRRVTMRLDELGERWSLVMGPERLVLARHAELRLAVEGPATVLRDGVEVDARQIPGALVVEVVELGELFEVLPGDQP